MNLDLFDTDRCCHPDNDNLRVVPRTKFMNGYDAVVCVACGRQYTVWHDDRGIRLAA